VVFSFSFFYLQKGELPPGRSVSSNKEFPFPDMELEKELNELRRRARGY